MQLLNVSVRFWTLQAIILNFSGRIVDIALPFEKNSVFSSHMDSSRSKYMQITYEMAWCISWWELIAQFFVEKLVPKLVISSDKCFETPKTLSDRSSTIWTSYGNVFSKLKKLSQKLIFARCKKFLKKNISKCESYITACYLAFGWKCSPKYCCVFLFEVHWTSAEFWY